MAPELNWSPDQQRAMTAAFRAEIEQQRLARQLPMQAATADGAKDGEREDDAREGSRYM